MGEFEPTDRIIITSRTGKEHIFKGRHVESIQEDPGTGMVWVVPTKGEPRKYRDPKSIAVGPAYHPRIFK